MQVTQGTEQGNVRNTVHGNGAGQPHDAGKGEQNTTLHSVSSAAQILDGKWTTRIVTDLLEGPKRFSQLERSLSGISPKILTHRLKMLESAGLVIPRQYSDMPPRNEYELTAIGYELRGVIEAMAAFGTKLSSSAQRGASTKPVVSQKHQAAVEKSRMAPVAFEPVAIEPAPFETAAPKPQNEQGKDAALDERKSPALSLDFLRLGPTPEKSSATPASATPASATAASDTSSSATPPADQKKRGLFDGLRPQRITR